MRWTLRVSTIACVSAPLYATLLAAAFVATQRGFGSSDVIPFAIWTVPLAVVCAIMTPAVLWRVATRRRSVALTLLAVSGAVTGLFYTFVVAASVGGYIHAFSFPVLWIWLVAAALSFVTCSLVAQRPAMAIAKPPRLARRTAGAIGVLVVTFALPIILILGGALLWDRIEPEIHLLPNGYRGVVLIIFGDSAGAPERREGKTRVYEIPHTGVLRTRFRSNPGWSSSQSRRFFYVDSAGRRKLLRPSFNCRDSLPRNVLDVCTSGLIMDSEAPNAPDYDAYILSARGERRFHERREWALVRSHVMGLAPRDAP